MFKILGLLKSSFCLGVVFFFFPQTAQQAKAQILLTEDYKPFPQFCLNGIL